MSTPEEQKAALNAARLRSRESLNLQQGKNTFEKNIQEQEETSKTYPSLSLLQDAVARRSAQQRQQQRDAQTQDERRRQSDQVKKIAKAAIRRGVMYVASLISSVTFILGVIVNIFTLGWLNLEMIYGKYFAKGKSRSVPALSWEPIPMPIDKEAIILSGIIVAADIALVVVLMMISFGGLCVIHDFVQITNSVSGANQIGASIAQGQGGGLCTGGIISSTFGL